MRGGKRQFLELVPPLSDEESVDVERSACSVERPVLELVADPDNPGSGGLALTATVACFDYTSVSSLPHTPSRLIVLF